MSHDLKSDHNAVLCRLNVPKSVSEPATISFPNLKKIDKESFRDDLAICLSAENTVSVSEYNDTLKSVLDRHAPLCQRTFRRRTSLAN